MYIEYLDELLGTPDCDNLLLDNMAIMLRSEEMCALSRVCAILHYSISMPMRRFAAKTHTLAEHNWSIRPMGRAIDLVFSTVQKIKEDAKLLSDSNFMSSIFNSLREVRSLYYCISSLLLRLHAHNVQLIHQLGITTN
jgi:hypothetical protein